MYYWTYRSRFFGLLVFFVMWLDDISVNMQIRILFSVLADG